MDDLGYPYFRKPPYKPWYQENSGMSVWHIFLLGPGLHFSWGCLSSMWKHVSMNWFKEHLRDHGFSVFPINISSNKRGSCQTFPSTQVNPSLGNMDIQWYASPRDSIWTMLNGWKQWKQTSHDFRVMTFESWVFSGMSNLHHHVDGWQHGYTVHCWSTL